MIKFARDFAIYAHGNQRYGDQPYVVHLDSVSQLLQPYGETAQIIGYLHDILEDTEITAEQLRTQFGSFITECVKIVSDEPGEDRKERKIKTYEKMAKINAEYELALLVKTADRLANIKASLASKSERHLKTYRDEHEEFRAAVFRDGLGQPLWQELDSLMDLDRIRIQD